MCQKYAQKREREREKKKRKEKECVARAAPSR